MNLGSFNKIIWILYLCCLGGVIARFLASGLYRRYPALTAFVSLDFLGSIVGLVSGDTSTAYWWTYFAFSSLSGSVLAVLMAREMFAELYNLHLGLRGLTRMTLRRSILGGALVTSVLAPVVLIHWGEPDFQCWQLPFIELHRAAKYGQAIFIILMWRNLRWLPLRVPNNVRTYSYSVGLYNLVGGLLATVVLVKHTPSVTDLCDSALLLVSIVFCLVLLTRITVPVSVPDAIPCFPVDPELVQQLTSVEGLLAMIEAAESRARTRRNRRLILLMSGPLRRIRKGWPTGNDLLHSLQVSLGLGDSGASSRGRHPHPMD